MLGRAYPVRVVVDQARDHRAAFKIDHLGAAVGELADIGVAPRCYHALILDRQRLHDGETVIDGHDLAVDDYRVHSTRCEWNKKTQ